MAFLRIVEVFPPLFPLWTKSTDSADPGHKVEEFVRSVEGIRGHSDLILVASLKDPSLVSFSPLQAALILKDRLGMETAPTIVVRDFNRLQFRSTIMTCMAMGLGSMMLAWGDRFAHDARISNVRDYAVLSQAIEESRHMAVRTHRNIKFLAPVDVSRLSGRAGVELATSRLRAGAEYLLAQPPTVDSRISFDEHAALLESSGLKDKVLLNIFPFWNRKDVIRCERYFGWKLPSTLKKTASGGRDAVLSEARSVARRIRREGHPGVYLATRGHPEIARDILG